MTPVVTIVIQVVTMPIHAITIPIYLVTMPIQVVTMPILAVTMRRSWWSRCADPGGHDGASRAPSGELDADTLQALRDAVDPP